jgi:hypothetical protein
MAVTINADTITGAAVVTADASGELALQAAGVTKLTVAAAGVTLASPLPIASGGTGATSLSGLTVGTATTATNIAGGSNGTIPYQSASGTTQMLAVGSSGQVLQTNGAGAPSWTTPSAGAITLLSTQNPSGQADPTFTSGISSTYKVYKLFFQLYATSTGTTWTPQIRFYANGAVDSNPVYGFRYLTQSGTYSQGSGNNGPSLHNVQSGQNPSYVWTVDMTIFTNSNVAGYYTASYYASGQVNAGTQIISASGAYEGVNGRNGPITGIQVVTGGTNVTGICSLYGISS